MPDASPPDLVDRLRAIAEASANVSPVPVFEAALSPEQVARGLEAAAQCSGCAGVGLLRIPNGVRCPGGADGARCENGLDPARIAAFLAAAGEGK
jgi:hypothetical protein